MTLEELIKTITDGMRGLVPVVVRESPKNDATFDGSLDEYLTAVVGCANGKPSPILIEQRLFDELDFFVRDPSASAEEAAQKIRTGQTDIQPLMRDVRGLDPEMRRFEQYIGQSSAFTLVARLGDSWRVRWVMTEPWYDEFAEASDAIEEDLKEKAVEKRQQAGEIQSRRKEELLTKLRALADDPAFVALKAHRAVQRAMKTYAFEHIPGLEELGVEVIREEISLLSDKVALKQKG
jgi:hypothetical protein